MANNLAAILRGKNVFVQGVGFIGKVGDIELPEVTFKQADVNGQDVDTGLLDKLEGKITIYEFNEILFEAVEKRLNDTATFVIKASVVNSGVETSIYVEIGAWVKKQGFELKNAAENAGVTLELNIQTYRLEIDGKEVYNIDIPNNICKINGSDKYDTLRKHIM